MKLIHFRLGLFFLTFIVSGCATNDSNSSLVRFWNDGFVYSEKRAAANEYCSHLVNKKYTSFENNDWYDFYRDCMKKSGY